MESVDQEQQSGGAPTPDFTEAAYRQILKAALKRFQFVTFDKPNGFEFALLLRHDIDFSIGEAVRIASIEAELGVSSTYLVDCHSPYYNPMEKLETLRLRQLVSLGHQIGVHLDATYYEIAEESELISALRREAEFVEHLTGTAPRAFSFHNPTFEHLNFRDVQYSGLINCYSDELRRSFKYCSDSNGYWRFDSIHKVLADSSISRVQLLIHAEHWQPNEYKTRERIRSLVFGRASRGVELYDQLLRGSQRDNVTARPQFLWKIRDHSPALFDLLDTLYAYERPDLILATLLRIRGRHTHESETVSETERIFEKAADLVSMVQTGVQVSEEALSRVIEEVALELLSDERVAPF